MDLYEKKYKEVLARAREIHRNEGEKRRDMEFIFPELAESEDEKIKNRLINLIKMSSEFGGLALHKWEADEMLAWIEKQSEHANFLSKIQIGDKVTRNEAGVLVNLSQLKRVAKPSEKQCEQKFGMKTAEESLSIDSDTYNKIVDECIFGEQKPEENKGNIGGISPNWSEEDKCEIQHIIDFLNHPDWIKTTPTIVDNCKNWLKSIKDRVQPKQEWSEEDESQKELAESYLAKFDEKFPILPTLKGKRLADYKNFLNKCQQIFGLKYWGIRPRQAKLFEKLSLLWAAWGAEHLQGLGQTDGDMDDEISIWSEEDEELLKWSIHNLTELKDRFGEEYGKVGKCIDWVNSLQDRVQPQPKQEWSEEDKYMYDILCGTIENTDINENTKYKLISWLKSLKGRVQPQNQWKPSDEQIAQLQIVIDTYGNEGIYDPILTELLFQLKKLKEGKV